MPPAFQGQSIACFYRMGNPRQKRPTGFLSFQCTVRRRGLFPASTQNIRHLDGLFRGCVPLYSLAHFPTLDKPAEKNSQTCKDLLWEVLLSLPFLQNCQPSAPGSASPRIGCAHPLDGRKSPLASPKNRMHQGTFVPQHQVKDQLSGLERGTGHAILCLLLLSQSLLWAVSADVPG